VDRTAHGDEGGLGLEDVDLVFAHAEADGPGALVAIHERMGDEDALVDLAVGFGDGVLGGLGDDALVGLAVDHELPATFVDVLAVGVGPDGEAPLLEEVDRGVHVPRDAGHEVLTGDAHEVVAHVVKVIVKGVVSAVEIDVLVDRREAHGDGAGAIHRGLVHDRDLEAMLLGPVCRFDRSAAGGHPATEEQQIGFDCDCFEISHFPISP